MNVWIVGIRNSEENIIFDVYGSEERALERWNKELKSIEEGYEKIVEDFPDHKFAKTCLESIKKSTGPEDLDLYPFDEPYLIRMEIK